VGAKSATGEPTARMRKPSRSRFGADDRRNSQGRLPKKSGRLPKIKAPPGKQRASVSGVNNRRANHHPRAQLCTAPGSDRWEPRGCVRPGAVPRSGGVCTG
jgi:hypothetical protein